MRRVGVSGGRHRILRCAARGIVAGGVVAGSVAAAMYCAAVAIVSPLFELGGSAGVAWGIAVAAGVATVVLLAGGVVLAWAVLTVDPRVAIVGARRAIRRWSEWAADVRERP